MSMRSRPHLSVVIPAYNEEGRIRDSLARLTRHLEALGTPSEIIVVDDGSTDAGASLVEALGRQLEGAVRLRLLRNGQNRGKGYSIKHGVLSASGEYLLLSDADFSTPIEELPRLLGPVGAGECGIAIGSRGLDASRVERRQPFWRQVMGRTFNRLVRALTGLPFRDTQCGFKVMRRETVLPLFRAARIERFAYDVEILYLARKAGIRTIEVPVVWRDSPASKVNALTDSCAMLRDIIRIVLRDRRGRYGRLGPEAAAGARGEEGSG
jgi:dolichyl-phosphate beta-glucosyltransferase